MLINGIATRQVRSRQVNPQVERKASSQKSVALFIAATSKITVLTIVMADTLVNWYREG